MDAPARHTDAVPASHVTEVAQGAARARSCRALKPIPTALPVVMPTFTDNGCCAARREMIGGPGGDGGKSAADRLWLTLRWRQRLRIRSDVRWVRAIGRSSAAWNGSAQQADGGREWRHCYSIGGHFHQVFDSGASGLRQRVFPGCSSALTRSRQPR